MRSYMYIRHRYIQRGKKKSKRARLLRCPHPGGRVCSLCVCSWESGGFQLFKCGYPYLCKTIQLQKAASCRGVPLFLFILPFFLPPTYISFILPIFSSFSSSSSSSSSLFVAEQLLLFVPRQSRRTYICIKDTYRRVSIYIYTLYKQYI